MNWTECTVCGGDIEMIEGEWMHMRIEDFSHLATPVAS